MQYESEADVQTRLQGSVVSDAGQPVQVEGTEGKEHVVVTNLVTGKSYKKKWRELDLAPSSLPLGYVQVDDETLLLTTRKPLRRYKQGLSRESLHCVRLQLKGKPDVERNRVGLSTTNGALVKTMLGQFTSVGEAFQKVRTGRSPAQAFSRDWAIAIEDGDLCVVYRGEIVGFATDTTVRLRPDRVYLKESLMEVLV